MVGLQFSFSYSAPGQFSDESTRAAFAHDLRAALMEKFGPDAVLTEHLTTEVDQPGSRETALLKGVLDVEYLDGTHQILTPSQIIDTGANRWLGWTCNVGAESLFIRFDEIWPASCREGGRIGSIFDNNLALPTAGITCTAQSCNCIAGIKATKAAPTAIHP